jgi:hypothetical protein
MTATLSSAIDAMLLMKLRLTVARFGEMDGAGWWNTQGILGRFGKAGLSRGFPSTHYFAQARVAFTIASARCKEVFTPPACFTLWALPPELEELVGAQWQSWCRSPADWEPFFKQVSERNQGNLLDHLVILNLADDTVREVTAELKVSAQGRAVQLPGTGYPTNASLTLLAAAFSRGSKGQLAVPYLRAE